MRLCVLGGLLGLLYSLSCLWCRMWSGLVVLLLGGLVCLSLLIGLLDLSW